MGMSGVQPCFSSASNKIKAANEKNGDPPQSPKLKIKVMSNDVHINVGHMHQHKLFKIICDFVYIYII